MKNQIVNEVQIPRFKRILHSLATRVPKILLQQIDEVFPSLKNSAVSVTHCCSTCLLSGWFARKSENSFNLETIRYKLLILKYYLKLLFYITFPTIYSTYYILSVESSSLFYTQIFPVCMCCLQHQLWLFIQKIINSVPHLQNKHINHQLYIINSHHAIAK